ncbi:nitroreductase family protein [bacterium]|nr:nitroreductase family protein [bacterium]
MDVCPKDVLQLRAAKVATIEERVDECILCGQCVAVCPTASITMPDLPEANFRKLNRDVLSAEQFEDFLRSRRSVRTFRNTPVEREVVDRILAMAALAPMGFPPHSTGVVVLSDREERKHLLEELVEGYASIDKAMGSAVGRFFVRRAAGGENYRMLREHILHLTRTANADFRRDRKDRYTYNAPVIMLFHGDTGAMSYEENAHIVCHQAMLAALSMGLGSTIIGLVPPIVDRSKELRQRYGIPDSHRVITSLVLGYPKYRYRQSIQRPLNSVAFR